MNTGVLENPTIISEIADVFGSQAVITSIDVKKPFGKKYKGFFQIWKKEDQCRFDFLGKTCTVWGWRDNVK